MGEQFQLLLYSLSSDRGSRLNFAGLFIFQSELHRMKNNVILALFIPLPVNAMAVVACIAVTLINYLGARESGLVNDVLVVIKLLILALFIAFGILLGLSRISFAMAENRDLPSWFAKLHPVRATPYHTILVFGLIMTIFAAFTDLLRAAAISNFASLLYYAIANYAALRLEKPVFPRVVPVLGLITCILLLFFLAQDAWIIGSIALLAGIVYYYSVKVW